MNYVKMLGLLALAAVAAMAFAAGMASATVLCSTNTKTVCGAAWQYPANTEIEASMTESATFSSASEVVMTCSEGTLKVKTENAGSGTETVRAKVSLWSWGSCSGTTDTSALGEVEFHHIEGSATNGTVTSKKTTIKMTLFGSSCLYTTGEGVDLGTLTRSTEPMPGTIIPPVIDVSTTLAKSEGGLLCPSFLGLSAKYTVTSPKTLSTKTS